MIYEMRVYTLHPGKVPEFEAMIEKEALPHLTRHAKLVGWWSSEVGALNEVVHLWAFEDLAARENARNPLTASGTSTSDSCRTTKIPSDCSNFFPREKCATCEVCRSPMTRSALPATIGPTSFGMSWPRY